LDGTLADTSGDLIAAANACFDGLGLGPLLDATRDQATALRGGRAMLNLGFSRVTGFGSAEVDAQYPILLDHYANHLDVHTVMFPGAMAAVESLRSAGYKVGICTNKPAYLAQELMVRLGVRDAFGSLIGADTLPVRKPDPAPLFEAARRAGGDPAKTMLVGDTHTDRNTARAAGVPCVLVDFGLASEDLVALAPEAMLYDFADLQGVVQRLIG
jgi:phosphoglycolate phosphatase